MKLHTDLKAIKAAIASISRRGKILDHDIHVAGVSCLKHHSLHHDTTVLDQLVQAMPKGSRKSVFCEWAVTYGAVRLLDRANPADADRIAKGQLFVGDRTKTFNEVEAIAVKWYDVKPEPDLLTTWDAAKAAAAFLKQIQKAEKSGAVIEGAGEAMKLLRSAVQKFDTLSETLSGE